MALARCRSLILCRSIPASERLFPDILVPISGTERGWLALEQALVVAQREGSALHGFHVVRSDREGGAQRARSVQDEFDRRCQAAGVAGQLVVEVGPVARTICQRAHWTDLVVANLAFPPGRSLAGKLQSGFRTLVHRCSRPVLAVPQVSPLSRALLAFDGSPRAARGAGRRHLPGRPLAHSAGRGNGDGAWPGQRQHTGRGPLTTLPPTASRRAPSRRTALWLTLSCKPPPTSRADLLIMGGYGYSPMWEAMLGSAVDRLLRESQQPMLICK